MVGRNRSHWTRSAEGRRAAILAASVYAGVAVAFALLGRDYL